MSGWDSQLVARQAGSSSAPLDPSSLPDTKAAEYLLLWKNSVKPKAPFNLTPFALTLVRDVNVRADNRMTSLWVLISGFALPTVDCAKTNGRLRTQSTTRLKSRSAQGLD